MKPGEQTHIHVPYIFLETTIRGLHFAADNNNNRSIGLSSLNFLLWCAP